MNKTILIGSKESEEFLQTLERKIQTLNYDFNSNIDWITKKIALGGSPGLKEELLAEQGITHLLNVAESYGPKIKTHLFEGHKSVSLQDLTLMPQEKLKEALVEFHTQVHTPNSKVYIHCSAGQNRSASVLRLYFASLGLDPIPAAELIEARRLDAVPRHELMQNTELIKYAQELGRTKLKKYSPQIFCLDY